MAVDLCTLADVKRKLHIAAASDNSERDGWLVEEIATATSHFVRLAKQDWTADAVDLAHDQPLTARFYDVREDGEISLPLEGATVVAVRATLNLVTVEDEVLADQFTVNEGMYTVNPAKTRLRLRPTSLISPFENAYAERAMRWYRLVEVDYAPTGVAIPADIRDGVAMLAAGQYLASPRLANGVTSEKIGDYSYTVRPPAGGNTPGSSFAGASDFVEEAWRLLRPYVRSRVSVV